MSACSNPRYITSSNKSPSPKSCENSNNASAAKQSATSASALADPALRLGELGAEIVNSRREFRRFDNSVRPLFRICAL